VFIKVEWRLPELPAGLTAGGKGGKRTDGSASSRKPLSKLEGQP